MRKTTFIFAGIISAVIGTAYAAGENTVTSKSYVDAQDALKQNKITSKTSGNVVTYNGTDANGQTQFDERGIFDSETSGEWDENDRYQVAEGHEGDLMTAGDYWADINSLNGNVNDLSNDVYDINLNVNNVNNQITNINNQLNAQPLTPVTVQLPLTCANRRDGCTLWQIGGTDVVHKLTSCTTANVATDCPACGTGTVAACVNKFANATRAMDITYRHHPHPNVAVVI